MSRSVLVVEDDEAIRDGLVDVLTDEGWRVQHAADGRAALHLLRTGTRPDVILLDLMLPIMNGWEFRLEQRRDPFLSALPVVAMSADASAKAAAVDAHAYLRKPVDADALTATLERVVVEEERRRAERELEATRRRMASIIEAADDAIVWIDAEGWVGMWNPGAERLFGYSAEEANGQPIDLIVPADRESEAVDLLTRMRDGTSMHGLHTVRRRKDGTDVQVSISASPIREPDGTIVGGAVIYRDESERHRMQEQLLLADRLASMGSLSGGIAHEINNPLAAVVGNLDMIASDLSAMEVPAERRLELEEMLADARHAAERVRLIVQDLRAFSRTDEETRDAVDVRQVLESSLRVAWNEIRHRASVARDYQEVPPIEGNTGRLGQIFLNLILNAAHAIPVGTVDRHQIRLRTRRDGETVVVEVTDTGVGIPKVNLPRVFEPFFTTKPAGMGTGLGLSISRSLILRMGGRISLESEEHKGTTVRVELPIGAPERHPARPAPPRVKLSQRRGRVLVVDDDPMVGRAVERILARDHDVTVMRSARTALEKIHAGGRYDVILCDLMMPDMTGMDLYDALAREEPGQAEKMVFTTGGAFTPRAQAFLAQVPHPRIDKPFSAASLSALVRERVG